VPGKLLSMGVFEVGLLFKSHPAQIWNQYTEFNETCCKTEHFCIKCNGEIIVEIVSPDMEE